RKANSRYAKRVFPDTIMLTLIVHKTYHAWTDTRTGGGRSRGPILRRATESPAQNRVRDVSRIYSETSIMTSRRSALLTPAAPAAAPRVHAPSAKPLDVASLYDNPIGDLGWVRQHENGRIALEKALGARIKTRYVQVAAGADSERVMRT